MIRGGDVFSNGIHLNVIHAAPSPALEAWRNITAIDDVCREILACPSQLIVASVGANAGAGGVMMALGADQVILRDGVVLNPHYRTMGLYGSEYWTYVLPRRVGADEAARLTEQCLPIGAQQAARIGLVDDVLPRPTGRVRGRRVGTRRPPRRPRRLPGAARASQCGHARPTSDASRSRHTASRSWPR